MKNTQKIFAVLAALGIAALCAAQAQKDDNWTPPKELCSPDKNFCVKMAEREDKSDLLNDRKASGAETGEVRAAKAAHSVSCF
jgi:hypothetical protein